MSDKRTRLKVVSAIMLITLTGKILGLVRDMLLAQCFGNGVVTDAFFAASRIPRNFFDAIFASAISASFIPVFNEYLEKKGKPEAFQLSNSFITIMGLLTLVLSVLGMVFSVPITSALTNFDSPQVTALSARLLAILFPTVLCTGVAFSMVGILQSLGEFNVPAAMSVVSNGVIILYYIFLADRFGIYGLAVTYLIGWALQALIQIPPLRKRGYHFRPSFWHPGLKQVFLLMLPVMVSTWIQPINLTVSTWFASSFDGGVSAIEYANTLYTIVAGVFVLSIANVLFPELSRFSANHQAEEFGRAVSSTLRTLFFFLIPMTAGLMALAAPIIRLLYEYGGWDPAATPVTAAALAFLALGMVGYGLQIILSRAFYAVQNGRTPLIAGGVSILLNLLLCFLLAPVMGVSGLALATTVSSTASACILLVPMARSCPGLISRPLLRDVGKMVLCAIVMAGAVVGLRLILQAALMPGVLGRLLLVALPTGAGVVVYFFAAWVLRLPELTAAMDKLQRLLHKGGS